MYGGQSLHFLLAATSSSVGRSAFKIPHSLAKIWHGGQVYVWEGVCLCLCQLAKRGRGNGSGLLQKTHNFQMDSQPCVRFIEKLVMSQTTAD